MFKSYIFTAVILVILLVFSACHHQDDKLCHAYHGTLPAASSVGIDTTLTFLSSNRYSQKDVFIGEQNGTFHENGTYEIKKNKITLYADDGDKSYYRIENGQLRRLDTAGREITGSLADYYILKCL